MSDVLLSQLAHVELVSPKPEETVKWMVDVLGLEETERDGPVGLPAGVGRMAALEPRRHRRPAAEVAHIAWRTYGPDDLEVVAQRVDPELAVGWVESSVGHGKAFRYRAPHGQHLHEVFWEVDRYQAPAEKAGTGFPEPPAAVLRARRRPPATSTTSRSRRRTSTATSPSTRRSARGTPLRSTCRPSSRSSAP